jgi:hypothetical protein
MELVSDATIPKVPIYLNQFHVTAEICVLHVITCVAIYKLWPLHLSLIYSYKCIYMCMIIIQ